MTGFSRRWVAVVALVAAGCGGGADGGEMGADAGGDHGMAEGEMADAGAVHWSYEGETGPDRWGSLHPSFAVCERGMEQSPIDLGGAIPADGGSLEFRWRPTHGEVVDTGHSIQVNMAPASSVELEGRTFELVQFHFHLPSEHTVEQRVHAMEVHFVHQAAEGDLAVVGMFMDAGAAHGALQEIWDAIPGPNAGPASVAGVDPNAFLPEGRSYFRYAGSLTTPPCSEVVSWVVMTEPIVVSQAQVDAFAALYPMNARPIQPRHRRFVLRQ